MTANTMFFEADEKIVPLVSIDTTDTSYFLCLKMEPGKVLESIKKVGLINPPLVLAQSEGTYRVVCGYLRIAACHLLDWANMPVRILQKGLSERELMEMAIWDNRSHRNLNVMEQSIAVRKLLQAGFPERMKMLSPVVGFPPNKKVFDKIKGLVNLPSPIQQGLVDGFISFEAAVDLSQLKAQEALLFYHLLHPLRLSQNKEKEVILLAKEIGIRERIDMTDLLHRGPVKEIMEEVGANRNEKAAKVRAYLRRRRFPTLAESEERFKMLVKRLALPETIRVTPPASFEGRLYTLHMSFKNVADFKKRCKEVQSLSDNPSLGVLLES